LSSSPESSFLVQTQILFFNLSLWTVLSVLYVVSKPWFLRFLIAYVPIQDIFFIPFCYFI
jgi:hypothetical protein